MRKIIPILFLSTFIFNSCQYFDKSPSKDELLQKELKTINWNQVDEFPSVSDCETLQDKATQRSCFFEYLTQQIQSRLDIDTLSILYPKLDTIEVRVTVFADSTLKFEPQFPKDTVAYDTIKIDSILH